MRQAVRKARNFAGDRLPAQGGLVMVVGLCGVVLPIVPGLVLMWAAALAYGFAVGWSALGVAVVTVLALLVVVGLVAGILLPRRSAAGAGASGLAQLGGLVGAVVGFFLIPVIGVIVGALLGVLVVEYLRRDDWGAAWVATKATARGFGLSVLVDLGLGMAMLALWAVWAATVLL